jgi:glycosyltransferase AglD
MKDLTLVIPCYNEASRGNANRLESNIKKIISTLEKTKYDFEILLIDDCSQDNTKEVIKGIASRNTHLRYFFHEQNVGRGGTVSDGIKNSDSKVSGFIDIDLSTPPHYIPPLLEEIENGADIATAERIYRLDKQILTVFHRYILHKGYRFLVRNLFKTKLKDTETGCKFFNREKILPVLDEIKDTKWFWDTEVMVRSYFKGYKIKEIPTLFIRGDSHTTVRIFSDTLKYLKNIIKFRRELKK